jgi:hypothetical protein
VTGLGIGGAAIRLTTVLASALALSACGGSGSGSNVSGQNLVGEQGLTQVVTTAQYIAVLNLVPPEQMYTSQEAQAVPPGGAGELILIGRRAPIGPLTRHTEIHIYAKATGAAVSDATVTMTLRDHVTGQTIPIEATKMQDLALGPIDVHYGNNVTIATGHEFTLTATINSDTASFTGILA